MVCREGSSVRFPVRPGMGSEPGTDGLWPTSLAEARARGDGSDALEFRERILAEAAPTSTSTLAGRDVEAVQRSRPGARVYDALSPLAGCRSTGMRRGCSRSTTSSIMWRGGRCIWEQAVAASAPLCTAPSRRVDRPSNYWRYFGRRSLPTELCATPDRRSDFAVQSAGLARHYGIAAVTLVTHTRRPRRPGRMGAKDVRYFLTEGLPSGWLAGRASSPTGVPTVLWVGRMLHWRGPVHRGRGLRRARRTMPARMVMAGDGPLLEQVRATAERLGVAR